MGMWTTPGCPGVSAWRRRRSAAEAAREQSGSSGAGLQQHQQQHGLQDGCAGQWGQMTSWRPAGLTRSAWVLPGMGMGSHAGAAHAPPAA